MPRRWHLLLLLGLALVGLARPARASSSIAWGYPMPVVYSTAVRFLRLDRGCQITERDPDTAYLLFECKDTPSSKTVKHGALELFVEGHGVKGTLTLLDEPSYMEKRLLELLLRKLKSERGEPVVPAPPAAPPPPPSRPDGGATP